MNPYRLVRLGIGICIGLALSLAAAWGVVYAGDPVVFSEPPGIAIYDKADTGTFQATFYLSASQTVTNVAITPNELRPVSDVDLPRLAISQITIQHTDAITRLVAGAVRQAATVQVSAVPGAGEWAGDLVVEWTEPQYGSVHIPLTVTAVSSPQLTLLDIDKVFIRGVQNTTYHRVIRLRETTGRALVRGLAAEAQDLYIDAGDAATSGSAVIPASQITTSLSGLSATGDLPAVGLSVNLDGTPHGKYTGKLWLTSKNAADLPVPIEITVKHGWLVPALVMLIGLLAAVGIAQYRGFGLDRDKTLIILEDVKQSRPYKEDDFLPAFKQAIQMQIDAAHQALRERDAVKAKAAAEMAKTFLGRWETGSAEYKTCDAQMAGWLAKIEAGALPPSGFTKKLRDYLREIRGSAIVHYPDVAALSKDTERVFDALRAYENSLQALKEARKAFDDTPLLERDKKQELGTKLDNLDATLKGLPAPTIPAVTAEGAYPEIELPEALQNFTTELQGIAKELEAAKKSAADSGYLYEHYKKTAGQLLPQITQAPAVRRTLEKALERANALYNERSLSQAAQVAQNAWWAAEYEKRLFQPTRAFETGLSEEKKEEKKKLIDALDVFLTLDTHYYEIEPAGTFHDKLQEHVEAVYKFMRDAQPDFQFSSPATVTPPLREPGKRAALDLGGAGEEGRGVSPIVAQLALPTGWFWPKIRVIAFKVVMYGLAVIVLALFAWGTYTDNPTFGSLANYRDLFLWGFGVGLANETVIKMVTRWGLPIPSEQ